MNGPNQTIVYVTREIERALGMPPSERYQIIAGSTPYGESIKQRYPDFVTMIESLDGHSLGTGNLLSHQKTLTTLSQLPVPTSLLVFKNTARIELIAREHNWKIINPPATLAERIENKVSQISWLGNLASYLPPHRIETSRDIAWNGTPFIVQWAHGHTGGGTVLVDSEAVLKNLQTAFPERRARVTSFVSGSSFTVNVVVDARTIAPGNVSYQITGLKPFTDSAFTTVGNDWGAAQALLDDTDATAIQTMVNAIGAKMQAASWRGLFGVDLIKEEKTGRLYLIEINARQPASATFESVLQEKQRTAGATGMTIFEAHIAALLGQPLQPIIHITDGAQIIQRVTESVRSVPDAAMGALEESGYQTIAYPNTALNADLLRIQSDRSIISRHGELNERGQEIVKIVSAA